ncbi:DUF6157 family protein [Paenibacillus sp. FJAT-26967]|uniref:DUF6157 family protein n=1 Tax=Paenibacillus sp. FJAT-26967 TaxID=1729690 RepID=UPI0008383474|nr:DUF6157 family protein [Paenibacillus sp. FJAT-26967]
MKNRNFNYYQTFITVAPDSTALESITPPSRKDGKTKALIEYELLIHHPYTFTQEDLVYEVHIRHKEIPEEILQIIGTEIRYELFQKSHACLRASMLAKKYGWGIHFDDAGKIAIYPVESSEYQRFLANESGHVKVLAAMRSSRAKTDK